MKKYVAMLMSAVFIVLAILFTVPTKVIVVGKGDGTSQKVTTLEDFVEVIDAIINFDFDFFDYENANVKLLSSESTKKCESFTVEYSLVVEDEYENEVYIDEDGKIVSRSEVDVGLVHIGDVQEVTVRENLSLNLDVKAYFTQTAIYVDCTMKFDGEVKYVETKQNFYLNEAVRVQYYLSRDKEFYINVELLKSSGDFEKIYGITTLLEEFDFTPEVKKYKDKWLKVNLDDTQFMELDDTVVFVIISLPFSSGQTYLMSYIERYKQTEAIIKQGKQYSINPDYIYHFDIVVDEIYHLRDICESCGLDYESIVTDTSVKVADQLLEHYNVLYKYYEDEDYSVYRDFKVDLSDSLSPSYSWKHVECYEFREQTVNYQVKFTNINNTVCKFDKNTKIYSVDYDELFVR